jgi:ATP-dependent RNA circularization protein (DNA/RNA ligase family)
MNEYHKIQTVYLRDPATKYKTLLEGQFARPEFKYLQQADWIFTEKVDGTNIRIVWSPESFREKVTFAGKTDNAQIPPFLFKKLQELFPAEKFEALYPGNSMCLYGEGYGAKIQKGGGDYVSDGVNFILFDVLINDNWLERENVEDIATKLDIKTVPIIGKGNLHYGIFLVKNKFASLLRETPPEGLVMRPRVELRDRRGRRVITKLKGKDFVR